MDGKDPRLLLVVGPCSIHNVDAAVEYATRLAALSAKVRKHVFIVMRTYFEKPRTITGWKGLLYDPGCDGSYNIEDGIHITRNLLLTIGRIGLPCACEFLDPNMPQYYADLISWGAIGARTTESQVHRQLASGLSCPVGFKNSTSGSIIYPLNSIKSCAQPHAFPGISLGGCACVIKTRGNPNCHLVLRGSDAGPNYDEESVASALSQTPADRRLVMIDCSHGNSSKKCRKQLKVIEELIQRPDLPKLLGLMVESFILEGRVNLSAVTEEDYGRSVTDECISWEDTEALVLNLYDRLDSVNESDLAVS